MTPSIVPMNNICPKISAVGYFACHTSSMLVGRSAAVSQAAGSPAMRRATATASPTAITPRSETVLNRPLKPPTSFAVASSAGHRW